MISYVTLFFAKWYSGEQIRVNEMVRACDMYGKKQIERRVLVKKKKGNRPLET